MVEIFVALWLRWDLTKYGGRSCQIWPPTWSSSNLRWRVHLRQASNEQCWHTTINNIWRREEKRAVEINDCSYKYLLTLAEGEHPIEINRSITDSEHWLNNFWKSIWIINTIYQVLSGCSEKSFINSNQKVLYDIALSTFFLCSKFSLST